MQGDANPMRRPDVVAKVSGDLHWRHRVENAQRAEELRRQQQAAFTGSSNPNWNGGRTTTPEGRSMVWDAGLGKYVMESRIIMAKALGRDLEDQEVVHHKNQDVSDDRIENLELLSSQAEHAALHNRLRGRLPLDPASAPKCACGCGERVGESVRNRGQWNEFVNGHGACYKYRDR